MVTIKLARHSNYVRVVKAGKRHTQVKYTKDKLYSVSESQAAELLALTGDNDMPVFKKAGKGEEALGPQTLSPAAKAGLGDDEDRVTV